MATIQEVKQDFNKFERKVNSIETNRIPQEIVRSIKSEIVRTQSIDKGKFYRAVDFRAESGVESYNYTIDASRDSRVIYGLVIEESRKRPPYPPRRPNFEKGIEKANLNAIFDDWFHSSFAR